MKLVLLLCFIISLAFIRVPSPVQLLLCATTLAAGLLAARFPPLQFLLRSMVSIPFSGPFALILYFSGDHQRAIVVIEKTYLSTAAVILAVITTSFPNLLSAAKWFRMPGMLVEVTQLIYRYLSLLAAQAQQMRTAFRSRGGAVGKSAFLAASGIVAILFGRSYQRAEAVHRAMLSRGFDGSLPEQKYLKLRSADYAALATGILFSISPHLVR